MAPRKSSVAAEVVAPRRSRRVSESLMSIDTVKKSTSKAKAPASVKKRAKTTSTRARSRSMEIDSDSDDNKPRKKRAKTSKIITGINSIPTLFESTKSFEFDIPTLPSPTELPRVVFVFGNGDSGQHGLGSEEAGEIKRPRLQKWFEEKICSGGGWAGGLADIANGGMFTLAIDGAGKVWSWGVNDAGALGRDTSTDPDVLEYSPHLVDGLVEDEFVAVQVAAGDSVGVAISATGDLRAWGSFRNTEGVAAFDTRPGAPKIQLVPMSFPAFADHTIVQIATGNDHFLALTSEGSVFACGRGEQNQLGRRIISRHTDHGLTPERLGLRKIVTIGSGAYHSFAVAQDGTVYGWGLNSFHQLGVSEEDGGDSETLVPTKIASLHPSKHNGAKVVQIVGGEHHTAFLMSNGEVYVCGRSDGFELGLPSDHVEMVAMQTRKDEALAARAIRRAELLVQLTAAGELSTEEITLEANRLAANEVPLPNEYVPIPTLLSFPTIEDDPTSESHKIIDISSATHNTFAVTATGLIFAWGLGLSSQLGLGDEEEIETPTRVKSVAMEGFRVVKVTAGGQHSTLLAVRGEGAKPSLFKDVVKPVEVVETNGNGIAVVEEEEEEKELGIVEEEEDVMEVSTVAGDVEMN